MLFEICILPGTGQLDDLAQTILKEAEAQGLYHHFSIKTAFGYLLEMPDENDLEIVTEFARKLFADLGPKSLVCTALGQSDAGDVTYVLPKPGVTDSPAVNLHKQMQSDGLAVQAVRSFRKYWISNIDASGRQLLASKLLANDAIEQVFSGNIPLKTLHVGSPYTFKLLTVPIRQADADELQRISKEGQLYLSLQEMQTIQNAFAELGRDATDIELETLAQTWSEHCSHKTLGGRIHYTRKDSNGAILREFQFENMLKETIFAATRELCRTNPRVRAFCVSVFSDNAGVVTFDDDYNITFKAETHNRPSAIEPFGGAQTGLGGVIRDTMGTGLGAKPIASTSVSCFAPPAIMSKPNAPIGDSQADLPQSDLPQSDLPRADLPRSDLPQGVLHPRRIMHSVVAGVQDYGSKMEIPTVNGGVYFDERYIGNPLVFCGNIGLIPKNKSAKAEPMPGDLIVALGARTGRDGIRGATISSGELTHESEITSGGAVQIGEPKTQKKMLDVMLKARDQNLYRAVTDCGAGGFSSAAGEMGAKIGVEIELSNAPLKYEGLSYTEIWISEAQERMVLAVPPEHWEEFNRLCQSHEVEATVLGTFKPTGRLVLKYQNNQVADLDMNLLHGGRPPVVRKAEYIQTTDGGSQKAGCSPTRLSGDAIANLLSILSSLNIAGKHWFARRFDLDALGDAAVVQARRDSQRGIVVSYGMKPQFGNLDAYRMAASSIDEAVRNAVCAGADPKTIALLDNFCWGNTERPETLGSLVEAALACYDVALAFEMPFISGKDSLNNEFRPAQGNPIAIPPTLLISAMGQIEDVSKGITMGLKEVGNVLYQLGETKDEWVSILADDPNAVCSGRGVVPDLNPLHARKLYETLHSAIVLGLVRSAHDLSTGGLAVAMAEMCIAGDWGAALTGDFDTVTLFSESNSRIIIEVEPSKSQDVEHLFKDFPIRQLGVVTSDKELSFGNAGSVGVNTMRNVWRKTLDW